MLGGIILFSGFFLIFAFVLWYDILRPAYREGLLGCVLGWHKWEQEFHSPMVWRCQCCGEVDWP